METCGDGEGEGLRGEAMVVGYWVVLRQVR